MTHGFQVLTPEWVAPNLLTFAGWLFALSNPILLAYYDSDYSSAWREAEVPTDDNRALSPLSMHALSYGLN